MATWWVNQNQTQKQEIEGGFLWSPKRNRNGSFNQFYENMRRVSPGDLVLSYCDQKISYVGTVKDNALALQKPSEFGNTGDYWSEDGWAVPVDWQKLKVPVVPKTFLQELRPTLPTKYSPLSEDGNGRQNVYLAELPGPMAGVLLSRMESEISHTINSSADGDATSQLKEKAESAVQTVIDNDTSIDTTEKEELRKARRGQGKFRRNVEAFGRACPITGVTDKRLLRASHIKPWRSCATNHERLDGNNGLLLAPHFDHLFDRGYLSFDEKGAITLSSKVPQDQFERLGVVPELQVRPFSEKQMEYLRYHYENVFLK